MKLDLTKVFDDVVLDDKGVSARVACLMALQHDPDGSLSAQEKFERYLILRRIEDAGDQVELKVEDVAKLKDATGRFPFTVRALGRVWEWLDG